jgi:hypothetical protein
MGEPVVGHQAYYRNPVPEVAQMLNERHPNQYILLNLTEERYFTLDPFFDRYAQFPIAQNSVPTIRDMWLFCEEMTAFLNMSKHHVVCMYSKHGTGRCGLMVSALLLYNGTFQSVATALAYFEGRRTDPLSPVEKGNSLDTSSQLRFLEYFCRCVKEKEDPQTLSHLSDPRKVTIRRLRITGLPEGMLPSVHLCCYQHQRFAKKSSQKQSVFVTSGAEEDVRDTGIEVGEDEGEMGLEEMEQLEEEKHKSVEEEVTELETGEDEGVSQQDGAQIFDSRNDVRIRAVRGDSFQHVTTVYTEKAKAVPTSTPVVFEFQDGSVELEGEIRVQIHGEVRRMKLEDITGDRFTSPLAISSSTKQVTR